MELITGDVEAFHCGFADFDALLVAARVERAFDLQTGRGGRGPDQFDDGKAICQRPAAPVLRDVAEQPVLDPCSISMCRADSGGRGSRARFRRPVFAVRASRGAHAHHLSRRSRQ